MKKPILLLAASAVLGSQPARAEVMEWTVTSYFPYQVQLSFFSQRRAAEWPGNGQAYKLNDSRAHTYNLSCNAGEKICYGAWPTGGDSAGHYTESWGAGADGREGCTDCCAICGEEDPVINLRN